MNGLSHAPPLPPPTSLVDDLREQSEFRDITFSNYRKRDALKTLVSALRDGRLEAACNWSAELICAGHFMDMWNVIIDFYGQHVHEGSPRMALLLAHAYDTFRNEAQRVMMDLDMRNEPRVRALFGELVCALCYARKMHPFSATAVSSLDFSLPHLGRMMAADAGRYSDTVMLAGDPREITVAVNELVYSLTPDVRRVSNACYWIEWMLALDMRGRKKGCVKLKCVPRVRDADLKTSASNAAWVIWDVLFKAAEGRDGITKTLTALHRLFSIQYTSALGRRRRWLFYFAVNLVCTPIDLTRPLADPEQLRLISAHVARVDVIYEHVVRSAAQLGVSKCRRAEHKHKADAASNATAKQLAAAGLIADPIKK